MKLPLFFLLSFLFSSTLSAQFGLYQIENGKKEVNIPFKYENGFIVVDILLDGVLPLKFIFDTGAEYTILAKREFTDILGISYEREFKIVGSDLGTVLTAHLAKSLQMKIGKMTVHNQHILVLEDNYLNFEELVGIKIDGILGADFFKNFVVTFDFKQRIINLKEPLNFKSAPKGFQEYPIEVNGNKIYLNMETYLDPEDTKALTLKLLVDTGASLPLLIHTNSDPNVRLPENLILGNIGVGLGGRLNGYLGRIKECKFATFTFKNVITSFQEIKVDKDSSILNNRNGILGNIILDRFTFIIDYHRKKMHFKPNKRYDDNFLFDRSGLSLAAGGNQLDQFTIQYVIKGSPADLAGLQPGDELKSVNRIPVKFFTLRDLSHKFQKRVGKKYRLKIKRNDEKMFFIFRLKDII